MKTVAMDIPFKLHLEQISEFTEALFPSCLQAGYHVNCVLNGSLVHCGEFVKATWSGVLSDKCAAVINVWNKELYINVILNQTVKLTILWNIQWGNFKYSKRKISQEWTIVCWHVEAGDWHG